MFVNLKDVVVDQKYQSRTELDRDLVQSYADLMRDGVQFPPIKIINVDSQYILVCGFHRFHAAEAIGEYEIEAEVTSGTWRDVQLLKWQSNATHGKPLTRLEKRTLALEMLADEECVKWSDRKIGKHIGVSHVLVNSLRKKPVLQPDKVQAEPSTVKADTTKPAVNINNPADTDPAPDDALSEHEVMIETLADENAELTKKLAMAVLPEEERESAGKLIDDLRAEIKLLQVELESVKASRDRYQWENAELKKQVAAQQRQLKKLQG